MTVPLHFYAIRWNDTTYFGHRYEDEPDGDFFHWFGPTRMMWPEDAEILKDYGVVDDEDDDALDALLPQFYLDFPWPKEVRPSPGWLAPNGDFYPCMSWEHRIAATNIAYNVYGSTVPPGNKLMHNAEEALELRGWIRVYSDLVPPPRDHEITQPQLDTLMDIVMHPDCPPALKEAALKRMKDS